ncbi:MAG: hypothetical protein EA374_01080 [Acholeplasmatales bacterium]|nr:MAG: hypothetical protein EA374_01080 [Acholeplasmatales bacterium]
MESGGHVMETIMRCAEGTKVTRGNQHQTVSCSLNQYLNRLLLKELTTYQGRLDALRLRTGWRRDVPLYVNPSCCLFVTTSHRESTAIYINCVEVISIRPHDQSWTEIRFKSLHVQRVRIPYKRLKRKYEKACLILTMLTK